MSRSEAIRLANAVSRVLSLHGLKSADYGDPERAINSVFLKRAETLSLGRVKTPEVARRKFLGRHEPYFVEEPDTSHGDSMPSADSSAFYHDELPKAFFIERSLHEPDILDAFGLFDFFHWRFVQEIESEFARQLDVVPFGGHQGRLKMVKSSIPSMLKFWNRFAFVEIKNGFICWKRGFSKSSVRTKRWTRAESLWDAKVRCVWGNTRRFEVWLGNKRRTFEAESEGDARKWIVTIRANRRRPNRFRSFSPIRNRARYVAVLLGLL